MDKNSQDSTTQNRLQSRLLTWAALFIFIYAVCLSLSPAVRLRSWEVSFILEHWVGFIVWFIGILLIKRHIDKNLPNGDPYLLPIISILSGIGMITIWRLNTTFGLRQSIWLLICFIFLWLILKSKTLLHFLRRYKYIWLIGGLSLTILTFVFGTYPAGEGPRLWLGCCGVYFQPSEPLKLLLIVYLAAFLSEKHSLDQKPFQFLLPSILLSSLALLIIVAQHDIGTASIFIAIYFSMIYLATGRRRVLAVGVLIVFLAGTFGYFFYDLVQSRIDAWLHPWLDPQGNSYQIIQSLISIASGGLLGHGPGLGVPGVVPVAHSDFIYAAISEEFGLFGGIGILLLYIILIYRGISISIQAKNYYQMYLSAGISIFLAVQVLLIIGGNIRGLPLTGVTLPFVSYGGSSLLTSFISAGLLLTISNQIDIDIISERNLKPYILLSSVILFIFLLFSFIHGYWSSLASESILLRTDNPRNLIYDRYNNRGSILDRDNVIITETTGEPGKYSRTLYYPALSIVNGYAHERFGKSGLEYSLDEYLRGEKGKPSINTFFEELLYGQTISGLDIRISIDLEVQEFIDDILGHSSGSIIVLNAENGEILGMATHPYFEHSSIDYELDELLSTHDGQLLNRATQGQYLPGSSVGPFILASILHDSSIPEPPKSLSMNINDKILSCTLTPEDSSDLATLIQSGCPGAIQQLSSSISSEQLFDLYSKLGFFNSPELLLPTSSINTPTDNKLKISESFIDLYISPLQMSLAVAAITSNGTLPSPLIASAIKNPQQGWIILPNKKSIDCFDPSAVEKTTELLSLDKYPAWMSIGHSETGGEITSWAIGGTDTSYQGTPLSITITLEGNNPEEARDMLYALFDELLNP